MPWLACALSGCSLIYDPDRLPTVTQDATASDAPVDVSIDAPDGPPVVTAIEAEALFEGMGQGGSRPAIVVVRGRRLDERAFSLTLGASPLPAPEVHVSTDRRLAVLVVPLPYRPEDTGTIRLGLAFGGAPPVDVTPPEVTLLPELDLDGAVTTLAPLYARIRVTGPLRTPAGDGPYVLRAIADISIEHPVRADAVAGDPGTGACATTLCPGAGGAGVASGGGGGGGFGSPGLDGALAAGNGGAMVGSMALAMFGANAERGQPGGPGDSGAGEAGGVAGAGGGALAVWAGGDVIIAAGAGLSAAGGAGGTGGRIDLGGGGGGGSGGAIYVHAGGELRGPPGVVTAPGGAGGDDQHDGGRGGVGRIRLEAPVLSPMLTGEGVVYRGASIASVPTATSSPTLDVLVLGQPSALVNLTNDGNSAGLAPADASGRHTFAAVALHPGSNKLCVYSPGGSPLPMVSTCVVVGRY